MNRGVCIEFRGRSDLNDPVKTSFSRRDKDPGSVVELAQAYVPG